jgi:hypothetical protein
VNDAVARFVADLHETGIPPGRRAMLALLYDRTLTAAIASDCAGSGSVCDVTQIGYLQFDISSVHGEERVPAMHTSFLKI